MKNKVNLEPYIIGLVAFVSIASVVFWFFSKEYRDPRVLVGAENGKWLESGGIESIMNQLPDKKVEPKEFNTSAEEIAARQTGEEVVSLRTANKQVFKGSKPNELQAKIYLGDKYYLYEGNATYKPIDTSVHQILDLAKSNPARQFDEYVDAGVYKATWFADKPWNYTFYAGDSWIEYKALFDESDVLAIKVETLEIGVKETITLKDETAPTTLSWNVTQSGSGIITPPPTAIDAEGKDVPVAVSQIGNTLTYQVDTAGAVFPILVDPTSINATNDSGLRNLNASYSTARNATIASNNEDGYRWKIGQTASYDIYRSFGSFAIPDMTTLTAATLFIYGVTDYSTTDFNVYIHTSTHSTPILADFDQFAGWVSSGTYTGTILNNAWSSSSFLVGWNQITFNADGLAAILAKKNDTFKMAAISSRDYAETTPSGNEWLEFYGSVSGVVPYLSITYTTTAPPTVTTQEPTDKATTSVTANGNITATGGADATVRGFAYGTDPTLSTVIATTTDTVGQPFGTGAFTGAIASLTKGTNYYIRAYATNSAGTGLGSIQPFTTTIQSDEIIFRRDVIFGKDVILK